MYDTTLIGTFSASLQDLFTLAESTRDMQGLEEHDAGLCCDI